MSTRSLDLVQTVNDMFVNDPLLLLLALTHFEFKEIWIWFSPPRAENPVPMQLAVYYCPIRQSDSDRLPVPKLQPTRTIAQYMYVLEFDHRVSHLRLGQHLHPHSAVFLCDQRPFKPISIAFLQVSESFHRQFILLPLCKQVLVRIGNLASSGCVWLLS